MAGSTSSAYKAWETRRRNGKDKNSAESNEKRRQTMLDFARSEPEWVEFCRTAALGNRASTGMAPVNKGKTWEESYGLEGAELLRQKHAESMVNCQRKSGADIELLTISILDDLKINYVFQVAMYGTVVDFYLPETKTVIFIDGCYWHGHNCKFNPFHENLTKNQIQRQQKDRLDNTRLIRSNHPVIRIWGCELDKLQSKLNEVQK